MIICDPVEVEDVTMQQVYKYAEMRKLPIAFYDYDGIQDAFERVCRASICKTQREIYDEMVESKGKIQFDCIKCDHSDTCEKTKQGVRRLSLPPLSKRGDKPECWVCVHVWRMQVSNQQRKCDVCRTVKPLNDESVQIKHTRG